MGPDQSWVLNQNPNPRLNFNLTGPPQFAGDVNDDGTNDYLYASGFARDERTSALEDQTGKTALFYGGAPPKTEDQLIYAELIPVGDLNGDGHDDAIRFSDGTIQFWVGSDNGYQDTGSAVGNPYGERRVVSFNDVDGDGYDDALIYDRAIEGGPFAVLFGASTLDSTSVQIYQPETSASRFTYNVADLEGDGDGEIVRLAGENPEMQVDIFDVNSSREVTETQDFVADELPGRAYRYQLSLIDITGNDSMEVAATQYFGAPTYVFARGDSSGLGYQQTPVVFEKDDAVPVGDLDGDGRHDFYTFEDSTNTRYISYGPSILSSGLTFDTEIPFADSVFGAPDFVPQGGLGDVTGDGRPDAALGLFDRPDETVGRRFFSVNSDRTARSAEDVSYPRGHFFDEIVATEEIGDFNEDGVEDLAVLRNDLSQIEIFYGGNPISGTPDRTLEAPIQAYYLNLTSGDFNGDGAPDIAAGYNTGDQIDIYLGGSNADGQVDHVIDPGGFGFGGVYIPQNIGDINGDGTDDLLSTDLGFFGDQQNLAVFFGGSTLPESPDETIEYGGGFFAGGTAAAPGDVNGDGTEDFVVGRPYFVGSTEARGRADVYFGGSSPSFSSPDLTLRPENPDDPIFEFSLGLAGGDFNGDGRGDIAVRPSFVRPQATPGNVAISIFHGGTNVDDQVDQRLEIPAATGVGFDSDGDGRANSLGGRLEAVETMGDADRLIQSSSTPTNALLYRPNVTASPAAVFRAPNQDADMGNAYYSSIAAGDFTGDQSTDFVFTQANDDNDAAESSRVYRYQVGNLEPVAEADAYSTPSGTPLSIAAPGVLDNDTEPEGDSLTATLTDSTSNGRLTLNEDGSFEYAPDSGFAGTDRFTYAAEDPNGATDTADVTLSVTREVLALTSVRPESGAPGTQVRLYGDDFGPTPSENTVTFGGVEGVVDSVGPNVLYARVPSGVSGPGDVSVTTGESSVTAAQSFTAIVGGQGSFSTVGAGLTGIHRGAVDWGDYNGDGAPDIAVVGEGNVAKIYRNDGDGTFTDIEAGLTGVGEDASVEWGDYNGDGALDLVVLGNSNQNGATTTIYRNDGNGVFTPIDAGIINLFRGTADWGDYNGDGALDLVVTGYDGDRAWTKIYQNEGDGVFTEVGANLEGVFNSSVEWGDYNNDGRLDLVVTGSFSATIYRNDGDGTFTDIEAGLTGVNYGTNASWGDYNGDNRLDLAIVGSDGSGRATTVYRNEGGGTFTAIETGLTDVGQGAPAWGDFDGDADLDLVVTGRDTSDTPTTILYRNEGNSTFTTVDADLTDVAFSTQAWGDYNGDGILDLLVAGRAPDGSSVTTLYQNQAGEEPKCSLAWSVDMEGRDAAGDSLSVTFGQSAAATAGIDAACGEEELPPKPPSDVFDLRFTGTNLSGIDLGEGLSRDLRPTDTPTPAPQAAESTPATWRLEVQSSSYPVTLSWDAATLADSLPSEPVQLIDAPTDGGVVSVNMKQTGSVTIENSSVTALKVRLGKEITRSVPVRSGWALVSIPLRAGDQTFAGLLPQCSSAFFFEAGTGYQPIETGETIPPGRGFFANCAGGPAQVTGTVPDSQSVEVKAGWNIVGPFADSVDVEAITSEPSGIVQTSFFGFDPASGYAATATLTPAGGYWVKASESGTLDLSGTGSGGAALATQSLAAATTKNEAKSGGQDEATLRITDAKGQEATLRLAREASEKRLARSALPPVPPGESFDVRFASGHSLAAFDSEEAGLRQLELQGVDYPLTLRLEGAVGDAQLSSGVRIKRGRGKNAEVQTLTATNASVTLQSDPGDLRVGLRALPDEFALRKSYPNPVSSRATIEYAVPKQAEVSVAVYDVLGRRVATLVDGQKETGRYSVQLEAGRLSSGTYFYRMRADDFTKTRRVTVVR